MFGEVLSGEADIDDECISHDQDGWNYLERTIYGCRVLGGERAIGFKILYSHGVGGPASSAWDYLESETSIRVIHLTRRNLLEGLISLRLAEATGEWIRRPGLSPRAAEPAVALSFQECVEYFASVRWASEQVRARFANHSVLRIEYERHLASKFAATIRTLCSFVAVRPLALAPALVRIASGSIAMRLRNYQELKETFADSEFRVFFTA
jgi:LPS sulfotransferase NodH